MPKLNNLAERRFWKPPFSAHNGGCDNCAHFFKDMAVQAEVLPCLVIFCSLVVK